MNILFEELNQGRNDAIENATHFIPKKSLGQNFLQDANKAKQIVNVLGKNDAHTFAKDITPHAPPLILEIGAGAGALTRFITEQYSSVYILERDPYWAGVHSILLPTICTNALTFPWEKLHSSYGKIWKIIGNLPYNIASPLLWDILSLSDCYAVFMVQKEVGERIIAQAHTSAYGALSIWLQSFSIPKKEYIVPPTAFFPAPKIDSMVLSFTPRSAEERSAVPKALQKMLSLLFSQRRKQIQSVLRGQFPNILSVLEELQLPHTARAEELSISTLHALTKILYEE